MKTLKVNTCENSTYKRVLKLVVNNGIYVVSLFGLNKINVDSNIEKVLLETDNYNYARFSYDIYKHIPITK